MNIPYNEFLQAIKIISEKDFNELMKILPDVGIDINNIDWDDFDDLDSHDVAQAIIEYILMRWNYAYLERINVRERTFELADVDSIKDLEEIKETFSNFTITNYEELKEDIIETENYNKLKKEEKLKKDLLEQLGRLVEVDELENLLKTYGNAKGDSK